MPKYIYLFQGIITTNYQCYQRKNFSLFLENVPILYPLKTPENQELSDNFSESELGTIAKSLN